MDLHLRGPVLVGPEDVRGEAWVVGGRLTFERPAGATTSVEGWVLPGLVDAHCHVGFDATGPLDRAATAAQAETERDAGVLLLRDAGSPVDTRWTAEREDLPEIVRAGRHVGRTRRYIPGLSREVEPEDLARTVAEEAARGDGWVKLVGDWIDRDAGDLAPCWPRDALVAAVEAAHAAGARVTAHCFGEESVADLLAAGTDGIEHGTGLTPETAAACAAQGVAVVPTLINIETFPAIAARGEARYPTYAAHMRDLHARRYDTVRMAYEAGVPLYAGTDAGGQLAHGRLAEEVEELVTAGLSPVAALDAATWGARRWLGRPGLTEGAPADAVVLPADPRRDVRVLRGPAAVLLRGRLYRR